MRAGWLTVVLVGGCYRPAPPGDVPCAPNGACPGRLTCDYTLSPPVCDEHPGDGTHDAAIDSFVLDAPPDAPPDGVVLPPPTFVAETHTAAANVATIRYTLTVPSGLERFLVVSVQLGSDCDTLVPNVTSVTYGGLPLTRITTITGTPCGMTTTRSDQWQLVAPPTGAHDIDVVLAGQASTIHSGALAFVGIDQTTPVRATAIARGAGTASSVTVNSAPGDLVVNTVGQGGAITAPGMGQTQRFRNNVSGVNTLNNSGASTAAVATMAQTMTWTFQNTDEWQTISSSLQP